jgi:glutamate-1-semialdehyde 2,1-aminomutase
MKDNKDRYANSLKLFRRAAKVIPQGIYGHFTPVFTGPMTSPYYVEKTKGCRYWDVDGNEYIDYMCSYGPMVVGYNNPEVEAAAAEAMKKGNICNHPAPVMVELAEYLTKLIPFAGWAIFGKNGADMTNHSLMVARQHTGRKKIIMAKGAYHGTAAWASAGHGGVIEEDIEHVHFISWGDLDAFNQLCEKHRGEIAGAIFTPYHHPTWAEQEMPPPGFWKGVRKTCDEEGIILILDDVRAGFRLDMRGSHHYFGFEPDISCYCKAIANGYALSAMVGREDLRISASNVFYTGSYWFQTAPMAASLATLNILKRDKGIEKMKKMGELLKAGLEEMGQAHDQDVVVTGPPAIPFMTFKGDNSFRRAQLFCEETMKRGVFFHPHHNMFVSAAHEKKDVEQSIAAADEAFAIVKKTFGEWP